MITGIFTFVGMMVGALLANYVLHEPNKRIDELEERLYRNSGHHESDD